MGVGGTPRDLPRVRFFFLRLVCETRRKRKNIHGINVSFGLVRSPVSAISYFSSTFFHHLNFSRRDFNFPARLQLSGSTSTYPARLINIPARLKLSGTSLIFRHDSFLKLSGKNPRVRYVRPSNKEYLFL